MTPQQFRDWIAEMKATRRAYSGKDCGELLGISVTSIQNMKIRGCDLRTAIACNALLKGLGAYPEN